MTFLNEARANLVANRPTQSAGKVAGAKGKSQHQDLWRKVALRKALAAQVGPGAAYVPFCGDGDLARTCYPGRDIWGADLDPARVSTARQALPEARLVVGDCDRWPFPPGQQPATPWAVADLDAYSYPYAAFRAWWTASEGHRADRLVVFATDGQRQSLQRGVHSLHHPDGRRLHFEGTEWRALYNAYMTKVVKPWLAEALAPWRVILVRSYLRSAQCYWGAVVAAPASKGDT